MQSFNRSDLYKLAHDEKEATARTTMPSASYYLTLCQVVTPVSVPESKSPALQRFRFFFTRDLDDGRTRYWLHFGYFANELEATRWRNVLGRIYPRATIHRESQRPSVDTTTTQRAITESQVMKMLGPEATAAQTGTSPTLPAVRAPQPTSKGLEASLKELQESAWHTLDLEDTASLSGVRHLKVEIETKARARKDHRSKRKS